MRKDLLFLLIIFIPIFTTAQEKFRSGRFLHHSTGLNIWGPNESSTSILQQIQIYNSTHGYSGDNAVSMGESWWPSGGNNEWEYWNRIFRRDPSLPNIYNLMNSNKILVIKSCFPSSQIVGIGQPSDTLTPTLKTIYNYKWVWRNIINTMAERPQNFFAIWTNAPLNQGETTPARAALSKEFCTWAKDTLAMGLDPEIGDFPPNVYVFDFFSKLSNENGFLKPEYAMGSGDSHPNSTATELVAPQFVNEIFGAAIAYEGGGSTLAVSPQSRNVSSIAGSTSFTISSSTSWTAQSSASWCTVTSAGLGNGTLAATYTQNTSTSPRTAIITVSATGATTQTVTVVQAGAGASLLVSPQSQSVNASQGNTNFTITSNTNWTALSGASWCTVTPSGTGNGTLIANYTQNTSTTSRTASITVSAIGATNQTVTVVQAGATPTLAVSPQSQSVNASQGNTNFTITSNTNWTALSGSSWCIVTPSGTGDGMLVATYTQNTSTTSRTASITVSATGVATQTVTVVQAGAGASLLVSPQSQSVNAAQGNTNFTITSNTNWTALSDASWCTVTPSGNGNGTLVATYTQNTSTSPRTAIITVSATGATNQTVTVVQAGTGASLLVSPQSQSVNAAQGNTSFSIISNTNWTAQSDAYWCTATPSGNGNGTLAANYTQNTSTNIRIANIIVSATGAAPQTAKVVQSGAAATLSISPLSQSVNAPQGETHFSITSNTNWTSQSDASWCTVTPSGNGNGTLAANFTQNTSTSPRIASITVYAENATPVAVTVTQAGAASTLTVSPQYQNVSPAQGSTTFNITSNISWTASSNSGWCAVTTSGNGNGLLYVNYDENTSVSDRNATITIFAEGVSSQTVELMQSGTEAKLTVSPPLWNVENDAGSVTFNVTSNSNWTAQSDQDWCIPTDMGNGNGNLTASYNANKTYVERTAIITVSTKGADNFHVYLIQKGSFTSIQQPDQQKILKIYPNPSKGLLTIETPDELKGELEIKIINTLGQKLDFQVFRANRSTFHIQVNTTSTGIHFISITNGEMILTQKFILQ